MREKAEIETYMAGACVRISNDTSILIKGKYILSHCYALVKQYFEKYSVS